MIWLGFFVQWYINLCGLFNVKTILVEHSLFDWDKVLFSTFCQVHISHLPSYKSTTRLEPSTQTCTVFTQPLHHELDETKDQFLSKAQLVWILSFPSPRLVARPRLRNSVCPTIHAFQKGINTKWNTTIIRFWW